MSAAPVSKAYEHIRSLWIKRRTSFVNNVTGWAKESLTRHWCSWYTKNGLCQQCQSGKWCSFAFHHMSGFSLSGSFFSTLKRANSSAVLSLSSSLSESESINLRRLFMGSEAVSESSSLWLTGGRLVSASLATATESFSSITVHVWPLSSADSD